MTANVVGDLLSQLVDAVNALQGLSVGPGLQLMKTPSGPKILMGSQVGANQLMFTVFFTNAGVAASALTGAAVPVVTVYDPALGSHGPYNATPVGSGLFQYLYAGVPSTGVWRASFHTSGTVDQNDLPSQIEIV